VSARGTVGKLALTGVPMAMNQSCYGVQGHPGFDRYFAYFLLEDSITNLQQAAHGSVFDTITTETFQSLNVCFPATEVAELFNRSIDPLMAVMRCQADQNRCLQSLRDSLIPRLLSGELRVGDVAA